MDRVYYGMIFLLPCFANAADWGRYFDAPPVPGSVHPMTLDNRTLPPVVLPPAPVVRLPAPKPNLPVMQLQNGSSYQCLPSGISCWAVTPQPKK